MRRFNDFRALPEAPGRVVTIGNFDGVHRGHQALIAHAQAASAGLPVFVLTFDPHPVRVLAPALAPPLITPPEEKYRLLAALGVDGVLAQPFDREFAARTPASFVEDVLFGGLAARRVVVGYDFTFGAKRAGTTELLTALGVAHGFAVDVVPAQVVADGLVASSSKVREFVLAGRMEGAALVLGRPFTLIGQVVHGRHRGRTLGFPTANLACQNELLPKTGVYSGWLDTGEGPRPAVVNVGYNPTFEVPGGAPIVEAHVLDEAGLDLYGKAARLALRARVRDERKFAGPEALRAQIAADIEVARQQLAAAPSR